MKRIGLAVVLALRLCAADDKETKTATGDKAANNGKDTNVKVTIDQPAPAVSAPSPGPVSYAFTITLPSYCIAKGFNNQTPPSQTMHCSENGVNFEKVYPSADNIIDALKTATQFTIQKAGKSHLLFFCAVKTCSAKDEAAMKSAVANLSQTPSPRYFQDVPFASNIDRDLLTGAVTNVSSGDVTGRILPSGQVIRLETDKLLDLPSQNNFIDKIAHSTQEQLQAVPVFVPGFTAKRIDLPTFCLSGNLSSAPAPSEKCADHSSERLVPTANASDIATALTGDKIKVVADSPSSLIVSCGAEKCDSNALLMIRASAVTMAHPKHAYIEDRNVLTGTAETAVADILKWSKGAISADVISPDKIRLTSDTPVDAADVNALDARLRDAGFGPTNIYPVNRLFYTDAGEVVSSLSTIPTPAAPSTNAPAAKSATPTTTNPPAKTAPPSTYGSGLTAVGDSVVLSGNTSVSDGQRIRLLTLLDLPRPEVLLNLWSLQESSPSGTEIADNTTLIRSTVALHNQALQNAIEYGWSYLSRRMQDKDKYFDSDFTNYLTQRYVADSPDCTDVKTPGPGCVGTENRANWGICKLNQYCLGYTEAFHPLRPTFTNFLLGLMAAKDPLTEVFTTLGCMEGKFEVYGQACFQDRNAIKLLPLFAEEHAQKAKARSQHRGRRPRPSRPAVPARRKEESARRRDRRQRTELRRSGSRRSRSSAPMQSPHSVATQLLHNSVRPILCPLPWFFHFYRPPAQRPGRRRHSPQNGRSKEQGGQSCRSRRFLQFLAAWSAPRRHHQLFV